MKESIIAIASAIVGFISKSIWDIYWKNKFERDTLAHKKRLEFIERQLTEFYWPLLFQIRKNDIVYRKIKQRRINDDNQQLSDELFFKLSREYFFPNNEKMMEIIESKYYLAQAPESLDEQIKIFIRHQAVFQGMRKLLEIPGDPIQFDEPWPQDFFEQVELQTKKLQDEFNREVRRIDKTK